MNPATAALATPCGAVSAEAVIVTTVDAAHAGCIVTALDRGLDVITEKPMVIDETQCRAVLDAEKHARLPVVVPGAAKAEEKAAAKKPTMQFLIGFSNGR